MVLVKFRELLSETRAGLIYFYSETLFLGIRFRFLIILRLIFYCPALYIA